MEAQLDFSSKPVARLEEEARSEADLEKILNNCQWKEDKR